MRNLFEQCQSHIFLLNYQVVKTGIGRDARKEACISLMNFDPATNQIIPKNFMIFSTKVTKSLIKDSFQSSNHNSSYGSRHGAMANKEELNCNAPLPQPTLGT